MNSVTDQPSSGPVRKDTASAKDKEELVRQTELGFMFSHSLMSETSRQLLDASTTAFALQELLIEAGVIDEVAFQARQEAVHTALMEQIEHSRLGLFVNEEHEDKYQLHDIPKINCAERVHLCKAACCTLRFPLTRQDVEEGIVRWDFGRPYWNLGDESGYCVHCDQDKYHCRIYQNRPAPCRLYDCREDKRIWLDFEKMIVNPELEGCLAGTNGAALQPTNQDG